MFATTAPTSTPVVWQGTTQDGHTLRLTRSGLAKILSHLHQTGLSRLIQGNLNGNREAAVVGAIAQIVSHATRSKSSQTAQVFIANGKTRTYEVVAQPIGQKQSVIRLVRSHPNQEFEFEGEFEHEYEGEFEDEYMLGKVLDRIVPSRRQRRQEERAQQQQQREERQRAQQREREHWQRERQQEQQQREERQRQLQQAQAQRDLQQAQAQREDWDPVPPYTPYPLYSERPPLQIPTLPPLPQQSPSRGRSPLSRSVSPSRGRSASPNRGRSPALGRSASPNRGRSPSRVGTLQNRSASPNRGRSASPNHGRSPAPVRR